MQLGWWVPVPLMDRAFALRRHVLPLLFRGRWIIVIGSGVRQESPRELFPKRGHEHTLASVKLLGSDGVV